MQWIREGAQKRNGASGGSLHDRAVPWRATHAGGKVSPSSQIANDCKFIQSGGMRNRVNGDLDQGDAWRRRPSAGQCADPAPETDR
jgi:hypothetical protein